MCGFSYLLTGTTAAIGIVWRSSAEAAEGDRAISFLSHDRPRVPSVPFTNNQGLTGAGVAKALAVKEKGGDADMSCGAKPLSVEAERHPESIGLS